MVIRQYPHTITITAQSSDAGVDGSGNYQAGSDSSLTFKGRHESSRQSSFKDALKETAGGVQQVFEGICYIPHPCSGITPGAQVTVKDGDTVIATGTVKQYLEGIFNVRIWL